MVNYTDRNVVVPEIGEARFLPYNVSALPGVHLVPNSGTGQVLDPSPGLCLH